MNASEKTGGFGEAEMTGRNGQMLFVALATLYVVFSLGCFSLQLFEGQRELGRMLGHRDVIWLLGPPGNLLLYLHPPVLVAYLATSALFLCSLYSATTGRLMGRPVGAALLFPVWLLGGAFSALVVF